jgi:hypothetical protein
MCRKASWFAWVLFLILSGFISDSMAELYQWTDESGTVHYSDKSARVPDAALENEASATPPSQGRSLKKGWNQETLGQAILGCTYGMMSPNLASYRQRALEDGHQVTDDEMEKLKSLLFPICNRTCTCVIEKVSRKWSFDKFKGLAQDNSGSSEYPQYIKSLFKNKECPLPIPPQ